METYFLTVNRLTGPDQIDPAEWRRALLCLREACESTDSGVSEKALRAVQWIKKALDIIQRDPNGRAADLAWTTIQMWVLRAFEACQAQSYIQE